MNVKFLRGATQLFKTRAAALFTAFAAIMAVGGSVAAAEQGMRVQIDPKTGKIVPATPGHLPPATPEEKNSLSTSDKDLKEKPLPGGGSQLDLKGRFHNR